MTDAVTGLPRAAGLGRFLYADAGTQADGMIVTVLSLLARQDLDPWREAGRLAGLPRPAATDELARMLAGGDCTLPEAPRDVAARLLHLLSKVDRESDTAGKHLGGAGANKELVALYGITVCYIVGTVIMASVGHLAGLKGGAPAMAEAPAPATPAIGPGGRPTPERDGISATVSHAQHGRTKLSGADIRVD